MERLDSLNYFGDISVPLQPLEPFLAVEQDGSQPSLSHATATKALDIAFVSIMDSIDTSSTYGKLLFGILASFAEFDLAAP